MSKHTAVLSSIINSPTDVFLQYVLFLLRLSISHVTFYGNWKCQLKHTVYQSYCHHRKFRNQIFIAICLVNSFPRVIRGLNVSKKIRTSCKVRSNNKRFTEPVTKISMIVRVTIYFNYRPLTFDTIFYDCWPAGV